MFKSLRAAIHITLINVFIFTPLSLPQASAGEMVFPLMPAPGNMVSLSAAYTPAYLKGIIIHPQDAFKFDFLIEKGDGRLDDAQKYQEYTKLVKYFLAALTVPDQDQWVNLSPYEKNRTIQDDFGRTEMGRDLLTQDYLLKQITSSLMYPGSNLGKDFWARVYQRAYKEFGSTDVAVNTFNKVWIVPDYAQVDESGNIAYVVKSHLKVMLEEDYLSLQKHKAGNDLTPKDKTHTAAARVIKEIILPQLEKEVNEGKNFAMLRQVYSGMVLAAWYKKSLKGSLLSNIYADRSKTQGITPALDQYAGDPEHIYQQYLKSFKKGVFDFIKEDEDQYTKQVIPRKYFAGGFANTLDKAMSLQKINKGDLAIVIRTNKTAMDLAAIAINPSRTLNFTRRAALLAALAALSNPLMGVKPTLSKYLDNDLISELGLRLVYPFDDDTSKILDKLEKISVPLDKFELSSNLEINPQDTFKHHYQVREINMSVKMTINKILKLTKDTLIDGEVLQSGMVLLALASSYHDSLGRGDVEGISLWSFPQTMLASSKTGKNADRGMNAVEKGEYLTLFDGSRIPTSLAIKLLKSFRSLNMDLIKEFTKAVRDFQELHPDYDSKKIDSNSLEGLILKDIIDNIEKSYGDNKEVKKGIMTLLANFDKVFEDPHFSLFLPDKNKVVWVKVPEGVEAYSFMQDLMTIRSFFRPYKVRAQTTDARIEFTINHQGLITINGMRHPVYRSIPGKVFEEKLAGDSRGVIIAPQRGQGVEILIAGELLADVQYRRGQWLEIKSNRINGKAVYFQYGSNGEGFVLSTEKGNKLQIQNLNPDVEIQLRGYDFSPAMKSEYESYFNLVIEGWRELLLAKRPRNREINAALNDLKQIKILMQPNRWLVPLRGFMEKYKNIKGVEIIFNAVLSEIRKRPELKSSYEQAMRRLLHNTIRVVSDDENKDDLSGDPAMTKGGIDMNADNLNLWIKRNTHGEPMPMVQQDLAQLSRMDGFTPRILGIKPASSLPFLDK